MTTDLQHSNSSSPDSAANLFELAFESLESAVVVFDKRLSIILKNQSARNLLADCRELPDALTALVVESSFENWTTELRRVIDTRQARTLDVTVRGGKDQAEVFLNLAITPLRVPETGEVVGGMLIAEDVSTRLGMERRLAVSERLAAVGKLAARVAHELNNPLDGILRFTNLAIRILSEAPSANPKVNEYLEQSRVGILRMRDIVSSMLEFSRSAPNTLEQATINKIVEDVVMAMENYAKESKVAVICNFHQMDMPVVRGSGLFQVFCNLVKNAIDAMPEGGTLTITTQILGPDVIVTFEDSGVGLPDDVEKIFEPFFTTKPAGKGTGLGLAVCKELIEKYSGTIIAKSRLPKGASFVVSIPVRNCASVPVGRGGFLAAFAPA